jgi:hypothetical protein
MTFTALLSALGLGPKTLPQAQATLETAKATFDSVNALFASAGLNLETMLAAGPDSLKAHIASVSAKDGELATAQAEILRLKGAVDQAGQQISSANAKVTAAESVLTAIGVKADTKPEDFKALLDSHVKQQAALELAKTGHKPIEDTKATKPAGSGPDANATRAEHYAYMETLTDPRERSAHFAKYLGQKAK